MIAWPETALEPGSEPCGQRRDADGTLICGEHLSRAPYFHTDRARAAVFLAARGGGAQYRRNQRQQYLRLGCRFAECLPRAIADDFAQERHPGTVTNAGVLGDTTAGMLRRLDSAVPTGTNIVILQPGANDLRFGFSKEQRAANIAEMVKRLRAHDIRVIVFDPKIPEDLYQWDHIHFNVAAHANIAARLAAEIAAEPLARPATPIATQRHHRGSHSFLSTARAHRKVEVTF